MTGWSDSPGEKKTEEKKQDSASHRPTVFETLPATPKKVEDPSSSGTDASRTAASRSASSDSPNSAPGTLKSPVLAQDATIVYSEEQTRAVRVSQASLGAIGDYLLLSELGRGGMGVVYKARQRSLNRLVALKMVLAEGAATSQEIQRFRLEAEAAATLRHPNIVAIYEVGQAEERHYYSMEYVEGRDLADLVRDHSLSSKQAAEYVRTISTAMQYAHQQGILHRDLKPSNILVDAWNNPKITDFGLAKRVDGDQNLTGAGLILGTPAFMPPEQAMGDQSRVGPHSDVYSLGGILYQVLTGRAPFQADNPIETIRQLLYVEPVAPALLNPQVPPDLNTICLKCLEKDISRRYATAQDLADELTRFLEGRPTLARPLNRLQRIHKLARRYPREAILICALAGLVTIGTTLVTWLGLHAKREGDRAVENFELLNEASDHMLEVLKDWVVRLPPGSTDQQQQIKKVLDRYQVIREFHPNDPIALVKLAETHQRVALIHRGLRQFEQAIGHFKEAVQLYQRVATEAPDNPENLRLLADAMDWVGEVYRDDGKFRQAKTAFTDAIAIQERVVKSRPVPRAQADLARSLYNLALLIHDEGELPDSEVKCRQAIELLESAHLASPNVEEYRQGLARCYNNLGIILKDLQQIRPAYDANRKSIEIWSALVQSSPGNRENRSELANSLRNRGNLLLVFRETLVLEDSADPLEASQQAFDEAIELLNSLTDEFRSVPEYRDRLADSYNGLGAVHQVAKRPEQARAALGRAQLEFEALLNNLSDRADYHDGLAMIRANLSRLFPPEQLVERAEHLKAAIHHQLAAVQLNPKSDVYSDRLRRYRGSLVRTLLSQRLWREAAEESDRWEQLGPENWKDWYWVATAYAQLWNSLQGVSTKGSSTEGSQADPAIQERVQLPARVQRALRQAVKHGWNDVDTLDEDQAFSALCADPEYGKYFSVELLRSDSRP